MSISDEYGLVMPFVVCRSCGGPYEDASFVAGVRLGQLIAQLSQLRPEYGQQLPVALIPQADLVAMRYGYEMHVGERVGNWVEIHMVLSAQP